jgi:hypothetical protein
MNNSYLARENQRENSKVFLARGGTMYNESCDKVLGMCINVDEMSKGSEW